MEIPKKTLKAFKREAEEAIQLKIEEAIEFPSTAKHVWKTIHKLQGKIEFIDTLLRS